MYPVVLPDLTVSTVLPGILPVPSEVKLDGLEQLYVEGALPAPESKQ
jgi:hypothetical protein